MAETPTVRVRAGKPASTVALEVPADLLEKMQDQANLQGFESLQDYMLAVLRYEIKPLTPEEQAAEDAEDGAEVEAMLANSDPAEWKTMDDLRRVWGR